MSSYSPTGESSQTPSGRIIGRVRERFILSERLESVLAGKGCLVLIGGAAGIGKTTLVRWLVEQAGKVNVRVLDGSCYDLPRTAPYGPWLEAFSRIDLAGARTGMASPLYFSGDPRADDGHPALFERMSEFLANLTRSRPLILVMEDLQWADPASLELLRYLARGIAVVPLLFVVTYRTDELGSRQPLFEALPKLIREAEPVRIDLEPFTDDEIRLFVRQDYDLESSDEERLITFLRARSEGNPFYISELMRSMKAERILRIGDGRWVLGDLDQIPVPALVRQIIEGRINQLDDDAQRLLEEASVIGQIVPFDLWRAVSEASTRELSLAVEQAIAAQLVSQIASAHSLSFVHALVHETLYQRQPPTTRQRLHRRIAEALIGRPDAVFGTVAFHFEQAGDTRAIDWLIRTGERSLEIHAPHDAVVALTQAQMVASRHSRDLPVDAYRARASAYEKIGSFDQARRDFETVLERSRAVNDRPLEWQTLLDLGMLWSERDYERTGVYYRAALDLAQVTGDEPMIGYSLNRVANWHVNLDQSDVALPEHQEALSIFERCGEQEGIADTLDLLGLASFANCDYESSMAYYERAVSHFRKLKDRQRLSSSLASIPLNGGSLDCDVAVPVYRENPFWVTAGQEGLLLAREIGWTAGEAYALIVLSMCRAVRGDLGPALRHVQAALSIAERISHRQWTTFARNTLGRLWLELIHQRRAVAELEQSLAAARISGSRFWITNVSAVLAQARIATGDLDHAAAILDWVVRLDRLPKTIGQRQCWFAQAELMLAQGDAERALAIVDQLIASAPNTSTSRGVPQLIKKRGDALSCLRRFDEAEREYLRARDKAAFFGFRPLLWRVDAARGDLYLSIGRPDDAAAAFHRAQSRISELASTIDDELIRRTFWTEATGSMPADQPEEHPQSPAGRLSPRELDVLRQLVDGKTDREIADALFISPRTVMRHVTSILNKLGVSSRTAAATVAIRRNIV